MSDHLQRRLKQAFEDLRQALERTESALIEFEETLRGESSIRPQRRKGLDLLSIPEVCQKLGRDKRRVSRALRSGEIPSVKLGHNIKVKREDLEQYLEDQRHKPSGE